MVEERQGWLCKCGRVISTKGAKVRLGNTVVVITLACDCGRKWEAYAHALLLVGGL